MATTTNYGWTTPDDTGLVKDGASAIRTLGTSIDTTTKALNPSTTLGDIEYRSSTANTNTRLGIGSTGQVLAVSGGVPAWTTVSSGSMTSLASGTFSSSASVTISSISGSYRDLTLRVYDFRPATDGEQLYIRFNSDTGTNYFVSLPDGGDNSSIGSGNRFRFFGDTDNGAGSVGAGELKIVNYASASTRKLLETWATSSNQSTPANQRLELKMGLYNSTTAITSITIVTGGGNITSGSYELLGIN